MVGFPLAIPVWNGASARQPVRKPECEAHLDGSRRPFANAHTVAANAITKTVSQTTFAIFQGKAAIGAMTTSPPKGGAKRVRTSVRSRRLPVSCFQRAIKFLGFGRALALQPKL